MRDDGKEKMLDREEADYLLDVASDIAEAVLADPVKFPYVIERLDVFGSYLNRRIKRLGDIDIAVKIAPRYKDRSLQKFANEEWRKRNPKGSGPKKTTTKFLFYWLRFAAGCAEANAPHQCQVSLMAHDEPERIGAAKENIFHV